MKERPLSPHLQVYRFQLTMAMSILHRITGYALSIGLLMLVWLLCAAACGEESYNQFMNFASGPVGLLLIFGWSVALFYHMCNGVRHLLWDMGYFFKIKEAYTSGYIVLCATVILTILAWWNHCPFTQ